MNQSSPQKLNIFRLDRSVNNYMIFFTVDNNRSLKKMLEEHSRKKKNFSFCLRMSNVVIFELVLKIHEFPT